jgi:hypothetical protein
MCCWCRRWRIEGAPHEALTRIIEKHDDFADAPEAARPLLRHSAIMAGAAREARFKKRTLTNLYDERPTWLRLGHEVLDRLIEKLDDLGDVPEAARPLLRLNVARR